LPKAADSAMIEINYQIIMELIIVESPTKAKTISKFLTKGFKVESSFGHIRDLPKSEMGIEIENGFEPRYIIPTKARKTVSNLKAAAKKASSVILASDEDREGEAIAWHLAQALGLDADKTKRIVFHEITKEAILSSLKSPRVIDHNLVDAQQARRVLDRLVGYELSPFLWKKVAKGLSAGRVQSVATRLIVEREKEIQAFKSQEYWSLSGEFSTQATKASEFFQAMLYKREGKTFDKLDIKEKEAKHLAEILKSSPYHVDKLEKKQVSKNPSPPFTTSTLQQAANRHLGFSAKQTMSVAQKLYEEGHITYMRTDALNLSSKFVEEAGAWLKHELGPDYITAGGRFYKNKSKNAQEAHEAIRPTEVNKTPEALAAKLDRNQARLYKLIWQRAVASQMPAAKLDATIIDIKTTADQKEYIFRANGQIISFPGYLRVWPEKTKEQALPDTKTGDKIYLKALSANQHETNPPARYSDAGLVKELEKYGIGRPSTYAPTINTIIARNYVQRDDNKKLQPTDIAFVVIDLLVKHFPKIVDYQFTAKLEDDLDAVASGQQKWRPIVASFYEDFHTNLQSKYEEINKQDIMPEEKSTEVCDKCGAEMLVKTGRYGKFLACSAFPECRNIKKINTDANSPAKTAQVIELEKKHAGEICDKCKSPLAVKVGKYGPFLACTAYPKCKNIKNIVQAGSGKEVDCPACKQGKIVKKFSRRGPFYACSNYPDCKNAYNGEPTGKTCPDCKSLLISDKGGDIKCSNRKCSYSE
jgi:DNA topoisomerase-1